MAEPVVIVAAPNGGMQRSRDGAFVPVTPEEIAEDARLCREAGASIVHIHARDEEGRNTTDPAVYSEIIRLIRERTDILIQTTNGVGIRIDPVSGEFIWPSDDERLALINLDESPDLYGTAAGSTDFYFPEGGYDEETPYVNSPRYLKETIKEVYAKGSTLEYEMTDFHTFHRLSHYADLGLIDRNAPYLWITLGAGPAFNPADELGDLLRQRDLAQRLFPNAILGVGAGGRKNFAWVTVGMLLGCTTARLGLEDGLHLPNGKVAERNHHIIEELARVAEIFGRRPATPAEARKIMHLDRQPKSASVS